MEVDAILSELDSAQKDLIEAKATLAQRTDALEREKALVQGKAAKGDLGTSETLRKVGLAEAVASDGTCTRFSERVLEAQKEVDKAAQKVDILERKLKVQLTFIVAESKSVVQIY